LITTDNIMEQVLRNIFLYDFVNSLHIYVFYEKYTLFWKTHVLCESKTKKEKKMGFSE